MKNENIYVIEIEEGLVYEKGHSKKEAIENLKKQFGKKDIYKIERTVL